MGWEKLNEKIEIMPFEMLWNDEDNTVWDIYLVRRRGTHTDRIDMLVVGDTEEARATVLELEHEENKD